MKKAKKIRIAIVGWIIFILNRPFNKELKKQTAFNRAAKSDDTLSELVMVLLMFFVVFAAAITLMAHLFKIVP